MHIPLRPHQTFRLAQGQPWSMTSPNKPRANVLLMVRGKPNAPSNVIQNAQIVDGGNTTQMTAAVG